MLGRRPFIFRVRVQILLILMVSFLLMAPLAPSAVAGIGQATPDDYKAIYWLETGDEGDSYIHFQRSDADPCQAFLKAPGVGPEAILLKGDDGRLYAWSQWEGMGRLTLQLPARELDVALVMDVAATAAPMVRDGSLYYLAETGNGSVIRAVDIGADEGPEAGADGAPAAEVFVSPDRPEAIRIAFSGPMDRASVERGLWLSMGGAEIPACKVWIGDSLYLIPEWSAMADAIVAYDGDWTLTLDGVADAAGRLLLDASGAPGLETTVRLAAPEGLDAGRDRRATQTDLKQIASDLLGLSELTLGDFIPAAGGYYQDLAGGAFSIAAFQSEEQKWYMSVTLKENPAGFGFDSLYSQLQAILSGARLSELTLVSGQGEGSVAAADLPDAVKGFLAPFADAEGKVAMATGVNFFGRITPDAGVFGQAMDLILGPDAAAEGLKISGAVGYDLIKQLFASQNVAATPPADPADPVTHISLTIALPPITPVPFSLTNNKAAMHLLFSETAVTIDYKTNGFDISASRTASLWFLNNSWMNAGGAPIDIVNTLAISFEGDKLTRVASGGGIAVNWENAFGLQGLTLKSFNLEGELNPEQAGTGGISVSAAVNIGGAPADTTATFGLSVENNQISEINFALAAIDLTRLPGINQIPGVNEFVIDEIAVGYSPVENDVYLSGQTTWQRNGIQAAMAVMKQGDAFVLLLRVLNFNMGTLAPGIPAPYDTLGLPAGIVAISTKALDDLTVGDLPDKIQELFAGIKEKTNDKLPIYDGVTLAAAIDLNALPDLMRQAVNELGLSDAALRGMGLEGPLVLAGSVGGIFSGTVKAGLYLELPRIALPDLLRQGPLGQVVRFNSVTGKLFMRADLAATAVHFGLAGDLNFDLPRLVPDTTIPNGDVDNLTMAGEIYVDMNAVGVGVKVAAYMNGTWNDPLGLKNFSLTNPAVMVGFDGEAALEFGIGADVGFKTRGNQTLSYGGTMALNINFSSSIPIPKKFAIELKGSKLGAVAQMEIADALIRGAATGPMATEVLPLLMDPISRQAFQQLQTQLQNQSLLDIFQVDKLPLPMFELSDVNLYFATPGAVVPGRPGLDGMGMRVAGRLSVNFMGQNQMIGEIDDALTLKDGLLLYGALGDFDIGPVALTNAKLDLAAGIPGIHGNDVPRCVISGNSRVLFYQGAVDIALSLAKARFFIRGDWGAFGYSELKAETIGDSLLNASDFVVSFSSAANIYNGLREEVKKGIGQFLDAMNGPYNNAIKAIESQRGQLAGLDQQIAQVRAEAWSRRVSAIDSLNRNIASSTNWINHCRWYIGAYWWKWWEHGWYWGQIAWHSTHVGVWRATIWGAEKFYEWEISVLNPKIGFLEGLKAAANVAIDVASATVRAAQQVNNAAKATLDQMINEATRTEVLVIKDISISNFSLADALNNPNKTNSLHLDLVLMKTHSIQRDIPFLIASPANLFGFIQTTVTNLLNQLHGHRLGRSLSLAKGNDADIFVQQYFASDKNGRMRLLGDRLVLPESEKAAQVAAFVEQDEAAQHEAMARMLLTKHMESVARAGGPPANDAFADAAPLTGLSGQTMTSSLGATAEPNEPGHLNKAAEASIWWSWTAPADGGFVFDTVGSDFDTLLAVYRGTTLSDLTEVASSDDVSDREDGTSRLRFMAESGAPYWIVVDGYDGDQGAAHLTWSPFEMNPPANDAFAGAIILEEAEGAAGGSNVDATIEAGEPLHANLNIAASVWWTWTAPADGVVAFDTTGSDFDTLLAVYTGDDPMALMPVAANDDAASGQGGASRAVFDAVAGVTYRIAVDGYIGEQGAIRLSWGPYTRKPPMNDNFADAIAIPADAASIAGANGDALMEPGEPGHGGMDTGTSVWWTWTAPEDGGVCMNTAGSDFDTLLAVYTGEAVADLSLVAANDDDPNAENFTSRLAFAATAGTVYRIAVAGFGGDAGSIALQIGACHFTPPANDLMAAALVLEGVEGRAEGTNEGAGREPDEPWHAGDAGGGSIWWRWTAPADGWMAFDTSGSAIDTLLAIYKIDAEKALHLVADNDDNPLAEDGASRSRFAADAGVSYLIAVDGYSGERGAIVVHYALAEPPAPPANDAPDAAVVLEGPSGQATGGNADATTAPGEPDYSDDFNSAPVWWRWTAAEAGWVAFDTAGSGFDTVMAVYEATPDGPALVGRNDDFNDGYQSRVAFAAEAGKTYLILVGGYEGDRGGIVLNYGPYTPPPPPAIDAFAAAIALSGDSGQTTGTNAGATAEPGEPDHAGVMAAASVWFTWMAPADGGLALNTAGSGMDTLLAVYTGSDLSALTKVAENDDDPEAEDYASRLRFRVKAGTVYRIALDGYEGDTGDFVLSWTPYAPNPPENDDFDRRKPLEGLAAEVTVDNTDASAEPGEPDHAGMPGGASVWYTWTAPESGKVVFDTLGSQTDTLLAVYTGDKLDALQTLLGNDEVPERFDGSSRVILDAEKGKTYQIAVDGWQRDEGEIRLSVAAYVAHPPANDNWADAEPLSGASGAVVAANVDATVETGEPNAAEGINTATVWYRWTPAESGGVEWTTADSAIDTVLAVYTGEDLSDLSLVAINDQAPDAVGGASRVAFAAVAETPYFIAVGGFGGITGAITLNWAPYAINPPANDGFENRIILTGETVSATATNADAGRDPGEPLHNDKRPGTNSVWFAWTAPADGGVSIDTGGSGFNTVLAVYTGEAVNALTPVIANDDGRADGGGAMEMGASRVIFRAEAGKTYQIAVAGNDGRQGEIALAIAPFEYGPAPENDAFARRLTIPEDVWTVQGTNLYAGREAGEPRHAGVAGQGSVWYSWTAPADGSLLIDSRNSAFDTLLAVYTGERLAELTLTAENADAYPDGAASVSLEVKKGTVYQIAVDGDDGTWGDLTLALQFTPAPADETPVAEEDDNGDDDLCFVSVSAGRGGLDSTPGELAPAGMFQASGLPLLILLALALTGAGRRRHFGR